MKKVLFLILTTEKYADRQDNIINTWGKNVDYFFYSEHEDINRKVIKVCDENSAERKQCSVFNFLKKYEQEYEWFFFCDDDTFVNIKLLMSMIDGFPKNYVTGKDIFGCYGGLHYPSGGAGFVIHNTLLPKFYDIKPFRSNFSDVTVGLKMADEIIPMFHNNLFMWFSCDDEREFVSIENVNKYLTFHYINTYDKMKQLHDVCS